MTPHYSVTTIYELLRGGRLSWQAVQAYQEAHYGPCANGCDALGKFRTLDDRDLCETCYERVMRKECKR